MAGTPEKNERKNVFNEQYFAVEKQCLNFKTK